MSVDKQVRRNPFWEIIQRELPKHGYTHFHPEQTGNHNFVVVIEGLNSKAEPYKQKYHFPKIGRSFESTLNFKSALKNFLRQELPNRGFFPPADHRVRQPGMFIAKIDHDVEKKPLAIPHTLKQAIVKEELDVVAPPYIPEPKPVAPAPVAQAKANEPVSDTMVLAMFLVHVKDLSTLVEVAEGTAKFRGSKPAPIRLLENKPKLVAAPTIEVSAPAPALVEVLPTPKPLVKVSLKDAVVARMKTNSRRIWQPSDFYDLTPKRNALGATISLLTSANVIQRVDRGKYKVAK